MQKLSKFVIEDLRQLVSDKNIKTDQIRESIDEGIDPDNLDADVCISPTDTQQLSEVINYCSDTGIAIVPHGGRTGLSGGAKSTLGQLIIQTSKLNKILDLDISSATVTVESGIRLQDLEEAIAAHEFTIGVDLAARGSATIGGMVSTNAGGTQAFRNGTMRHRVLGLEVVLADGRILSDVKKVLKANEGYDIKQLFIGAEGTLGIITKVVLNLLPADRNRFTALISCKNADSAILILNTLRMNTLCRLLCAEIMWPLYAATTAQELKLTNLLDFTQGGSDGVFVIIDISATGDHDGIELLEEILSQLLEDEHITNALIAKNEADAQEFWKIREESFLCDQKYPHGFWFDVSVPLSHLDDYAQTLFKKVEKIDPKLNVFLFGHLGDGNLHLTISSGQDCVELASKINAAVYDGLNLIGGSFSAEHGIGEQKIALLESYTDAHKLDLMKTIKAAIDPKGIMNPGKVINV